MFDTKMKAALQLQTDMNMVEEEQALPNSSLSKNQLIS